MTEFVEMIELKGEGHIWVRKDAYVKLEQQIKELKEDVKYAGDIALKNEGLGHRCQELQQQIKELKEFAIWMTGCGYDFTQHEYFIEQRDKLLKK